MRINKILKRLGIKKRFMDSVTANNLERWRKEISIIKSAKCDRCNQSAVEYIYSSGMGTPYMYCGFACENHTEYLDDIWARVCGSKNGVHQVDGQRFGFESRETVELGIDTFTEFIDKAMERVSK